MTSDSESCHSESSSSESQPIHADSIVDPKKWFFPPEIKMYHDQYPSVDQNVIVMVGETTDYGINVSLLEYGNIQGMISYHEAARKSVKFREKVLAQNKIIVAQVKRIDFKGCVVHIDLSRKRVRESDEKDALSNYYDSKGIHALVYQMAVKENEQDPSNELTGQFTDLCASITWPLAKIYKYSFLGLFLGAFVDSEDTLAKIKISFDDTGNQEQCIPIVEKHWKEFVALATQKFKPKPVKVRATFALTCTTMEGILAIKHALKAGLLQFNGIDKPESTINTLQIHYHVSPVYIANVETTNATESIRKLNLALAKISSEIQARGGKYKLESGPSIISSVEDNEMNARISRLMDATRAIRSAEENSQDSDDDKEGSENDGSDNESDSNDSNQNDEDDDGSDSNQ